MDPRRIAMAQAAGRVAFGGALLASPVGVGRLWAGPGATATAARMFALGMAARDVAIGLGALAALRRGFGATDWLRAGVVADAADFAATLAGRRDLPGPVPGGVAALAAGSAGLAAYLQARID